MASLDELYVKVLTDDAERAAFAQATKTPEGMRAFLADRGCDATPEDVAAFLEGRQSDQGEIADEGLDSVAGGRSTSEDGSLPSRSSSAPLRVIRDSNGRIVCVDGKWIGTTLD